MYTRSYNRRPSSARIIPPPDYSGTSFRPEEPEPMTSAAFSPPPVAAMSETDEKRRARVPLERPEIFTPPAYHSEPATDPRYGEPRTDRRISFPFTLPVLSQNQSLHEDDILLISLILLLLSGSDEEIRDSKFILLILGYLFMSGLEFSSIS